MSALWSRMVLAYRGRRMRDIPRPPGDAVVRAGGPDAERVLLIGGGPSVGWGVLTHEVALAGHLARQTSKLLGAGVEVAVRGAPRMTVRGFAGALERIDDLSSFSAVVVTLGITDALTGTGAAAWVHGIRNALGVCEAAGIDASQVVLMQMQSVATIPLYAGRVGQRADRHRERLNAASVQLLSAPGSAQVVSLTDPRPRSNRYRDSTVYAQWAADLAPTVAHILSDQRGRDHADDSPARMRSALSDVADSRDPTIDSVVEGLRGRFAAQWAAFLVVDSEGEQLVAASGPLPLPDAGALARSAARSAGPVVVYDAKRDARTRSSPFVSDDDPRFFAAIPVHGPTGETIGALCVADPDPRSAHDVDVTVLLDAARRVELWLRSL